MDGIAEALVLKDAERLRTLALPVAVNAHEEAIEFLNIAGQSVLSLRHRQGEDVEQYSSTLGDTIFLKSQFVQQVLVHQVDQSGDKYAGVIGAPWGKFFYVSGPIFDGNNQLVGAILVGKSLDTLVKEFRQDTLAHTTVYDSNGLPLASSLVEGEDHNILTPQQVSNILARQDNSTLRNVTVGSVQYSEILGPGGDSERKCIRGDWSSAAAKFSSSSQQHYPFSNFYYLGYRAPIGYRRWHLYFTSYHTTIVAGCPSLWQCCQRRSRCTGKRDR